MMKNRTTPAPFERLALDPQAEGLIYPPPVEAAEGEENQQGWGFQDCRFETLANGAVRLTGNRYFLCNSVLPDLLPWLSTKLEVRLTPADARACGSLPAVPEPAPMVAFIDDLRKHLRPEQMTQDPLPRLRHGHGHTSEEIAAVRYGSLPRVPDLVVYPREEQEVEALVSAASTHGICLIPFGGGTNVTNALRCPTAEERPIVSVDMRRMNRVIWIDPVSRMAKIQAGATGRDIDRQLRPHGFIFGHEPDSSDFSTLGGWIATRSGGMKQNRYGNIEDLVLNATAITPSGTLAWQNDVPRESSGSDPRGLLFGSEGNLGIITSAIVSIAPVPETIRYGSVLFPTFEHGFAFAHELSQSGILPASVRLMDNMQVQFGQAMLPEARGLARLKRQLERAFVSGVGGLSWDSLCLATLVFEGTRDEARVQEKNAYRIAARHHGMKAGAANGERGYMLTYCMAYVRDLVLDHHMLAESMETSVPWSRALELCQRVKRRVEEEHARHGLPGKPFVNCRMTQLYETGVCIYFYFGFHSKGVANAPEIFLEIESAAREEILTAGGSVSHHHGVGKLRASFIPRVMSPAWLACREMTKRSLDPHNVFGAANQGVGLAHEGDEPRPASASSHSRSRR